MVVCVLKWQLFAHDFNLMQSLATHFFGLFLSLFEIFLTSFFTSDKSAASCRMFCNNSPGDSITPASIRCLQLSIMAFYFFRI